MADQNKTPDNNAGSGDDTGKKVDDKTIDVDKIVEQKVEEQLAKIKASLNEAYKGRDDALKRASELEAKAKADELKRLQDAGEHQKVLELQLKEEREKRESLERTNLELTRDVNLKTEMNGYEFKNSNAFEMAYRQIVEKLVRNDKGAWVHSTGLSIKDAVKAFKEDQENAFLFKQPISTGGGSQGNKQAADTSKKGVSLFETDQAEVLKRAAEGTLRRRR